MKKTGIFIATLITLLAISAFYNIKPVSNKLWFVHIAGANTRPTYDSYHHIKEAQQLATGKGIKVGLLDKYFGYSKNKSLFSGGLNFTGDKQAFEEIEEHGFWMATTLREIAPGVEIYALNARDRDRKKEKEAIIKAIDWAIENKLDILTYSAEIFRPEDRPEIDKAVQKAIRNNILVIFLHYDLPENLLPYGFFPKGTAGYGREIDVNVFHFDYSLLLLSNYENYINAGRVQSDSGNMPYFSFSSMPPVLAGIAAMMKEKDKTLTVGQIKKILIDTSRKIVYNGYNVEHVVDAAGALNSILNKNANSN